MTDRALYPSFPIRAVILAATMLGLFLSLFYFAGLTDPWLVPVALLGGISLSYVIFTVMDNRRRTGGIGD